MAKLKLGDLINLETLRMMSENLYEAAGIPVGIIAPDGEILIEAGWQDACSKFHRTHPDGLKRCKASDDYIKSHLHDNWYIEYKCENNLWDIAVPIIIEDELTATLFVGQFFYEDETIDIEFFRKQAKKFGFDEEEYISAIKKIPVFSRDWTKKIIEYYKTLIFSLVENSMLFLQYKRTQELLREDQAKLRRLVNSMKDIVFVVDDSGCFLECYSSPERDCSKYLGKRCSDFLTEEKIIKLKHDIGELKKNDGIKYYDFPLEIDGQVKWFSAQMSRLIELNEGLDKYLLVIRDISERKQVEDEFLKAKCKAEEANLAKDTFIANISHELRTPITVIQSALQVIEMNLKNNNMPSGIADRHMKIIKQNSHRLQRLINNLIDVSKIDAGFMSLQLKRVDIVSLIKNITASVTEYAAEKGIYIQFSTNVEKKIMAVDSDKMERILLNLLSNAIKFTDKTGSIFIEVKDDEENIIISITDTGVGISDDKMEIIFERFFRIDNSLSRIHEGSGIGLSLVKSFVQMHGGDISVTSKLGEGSRFTIKLPLKNIDEQLEAEIEDVSSEQFLEKLVIEFADIYKN